MLNRKNALIHFSVILIATVLITAIIYTTESKRVEFFELYRYLYYIPIIYAGYFFGLNGGFAVSLIATTLFLPILMNNIKLVGFSEDTIEVIITIVLLNLAAYAFGALAGQQRARREMYKTLLELSEIFNRELSVSKVAQVILQESVKLLKSEGGILCWQNQETGKIEIIAHISITQEELKSAQENLEKKYTVINWLIEQGKGRINNNVRYDPRFIWDDRNTSLQNSGLHRFIAVPLIFRKKPVGLIFLFNKLDGDYRNEDMEFLSMLSERGEMALENARLYELSVNTANENARIAEENARLYKRTKRANEDLQMLRDAGLTMSAASVLNLSKLTEIIIQIACDFVHSQKGSIMLFNPTTNELEVKAVIGLNKEEIIGEKRRIGDGLSGMVYSNRKPLLVKDIESMPELKYQPRPQYLTKSFVIVPLEMKDKVLGVLNVTDKSSGEPFTEDDLSLLIALSSSASIAIENATLYENLSAKERMEKELQIATDIQVGLLPREMPKVKGIDVYGFMKPAKEVGGDYFDFIQKEGVDDELNICIGDVSGKGVPAGLIMVMARTVIHSLIQTHTSTEKIIREANKLLAKDMESSKFVTMLLMRWNYNEGKLKYTSAGHEHIIVYRSSKNKCDVYRSGGLALGIIPDVTSQVKEQELPLSYNDVVILYTDGVTEARNSKDELFTLKRVVETVEKNGDQDVKSLIDSLYKEIKDFMNGREQYDDITLIGVKKI